MSPSARADGAREPSDEPESDEPELEPEPEPELGAELVGEPEPLSSLPPSPDDFDDDLVPEPDAPRSFFAQPEPLKWIVGGANCLRIVPSRPHDGQNLGPGSLIPWRMSARWSQAVQRYS